MSLNLNHVVIAGRLTRDPEVKTIGNQRQVASFTVAINRRWKSAEGETKEDVTFVDCEAWGRTAENIGQYLNKGSGVHVDGRLRLDTWEDKEGGKRQRLKVLADQVQFLDRPAERTPTSDDGDTDAQRAPAHPPAAAPAPRRRERAPVGATAGLDEAPPF